IPARAKGGARPGRSHVRTMLRATRSGRGRRTTRRPVGAPGTTGRRDAPERLMEHARPHRPRRLAPRELRVEAISAAALLAVAGGDRPALGRPSSVRAPGVGADGAAQPSWGRVSGRGKQAHNQSVPRFFYPPHGTRWIPAGVRWPPTPTKERQYRKPKGASTH